MSSVDDLQIEFSVLQEQECRRITGVYKSLSMKLSVADLYVWLYMCSSKRLSIPFIELKMVEKCLIQDLAFVLRHNLWIKTVNKANIYMSSMRSVSYLSYR